MSPLGSALPDLSVRRRRAEVMDDPGLEPERHVQALRGLARINRVSLVAERVWREVAELAPTGTGRVRVLDLGCGGGDVLMRVARRAKRAGTPVELHGCDVSPVAVERARSTRPGDAPVDVFQRDVLAEGIPGGYDLVTSSLFLHHLADDEAVDLLREAGAAARHTVLMQDLRRTPLGWVLAWIGVHALTRSDVARVDGPRSVEGAFTLREMVGMCAEAGLEGAEVDACWPQRLTVRWRKAATA